MPQGPISPDSDATSETVAALAAKAGSTSSKKALAAFGHILQTLGWKGPSALPLAGEQGGEGPTNPDSRVKMLENLREEALAAVARGDERGQQASVAGILELMKATPIDYSFNLKAVSYLEEVARKTNFESVQIAIEKGILHDVYANRDEGYYEKAADAVSRIAVASPGLAAKKTAMSWFNEDVRLISNVANRGQVNGRIEDIDGMSFGSDGWDGMEGRIFLQYPRDPSNLAIIAERGKALWGRWRAFARWSAHALGGAALAISPMALFILPQLGVVRGAATLPLWSALLTGSVGLAGYLGFHRRWGFPAALSMASWWIVRAVIVPAMPPYLILTNVLEIAWAGVFLGAFLPSKPKTRDFWEAGAQLSMFVTLILLGGPPAIVALVYMMTTPTVFLAIFGAMFGALGMWALGYRIIDVLRMRKLRSSSPPPATSAK